MFNRYLKAFYGVKAKKKQKKNNNNNSKTQGFCFLCFAFFWGGGLGVCFFLLPTLWKMANTADTDTIGASLVEILYFWVYVTN